MKALKKSALCSVFQMVFLCLIFNSLTACWKSKSGTSVTSLDGGKLKVSQNNMAFSVEELKKEPGEEISFDFVNELKDEKLRFYLLKNGEDPIVVQHIKAQQGGVPKEYYIFESLDVEPGQEIKVTFKAPLKEGVYSFVGVGETPRDSLVGRLIVAKKEMPAQKMKTSDENKKGTAADDSI